MTSPSPCGHHLTLTQPCPLATLGRLSEPPLPALTYPPGCLACVPAQLCPTTCNPMDCSPPGSSVHGDSPGKNTGVGHHFLLQGIFPAQGSKLHLVRLLHGQVDFFFFFLTAAPPGKPKVLVTQLCLTLCDPMDCGPTRSSAHLLLQARIPFSSSRGVNPGLLHCPWTLYSLSH